MNRRLGQKRLEEIDPSVYIVDEMLDATSISDHEFDGGFAHSSGGVPAFVGSTRQRVNIVVKDPVPHELVSTKKFGDEFANSSELTPRVLELSETVKDVTLEKLGDIASEVRMTLPRLLQFLHGNTDLGLQEAVASIISPVIVAVANDLGLGCLRVIESDRMSEVVSAVRRHLNSIIDSLNHESVEA